MKKQELIDWFQEKLYGCYHIQKDNFIFWFYNKNYIRAKKLALIDGRKINTPEEIKGDVLFRQDLKNEHFICDYNKIWSFFLTNYSSNYHDIQDFIKARLCETENLKQYTPPWYLTTYINNVV